jgi:hypothetical protein
LDNPGEGGFLIAMRNKTLIYLLTFTFLPCILCVLVSSWLKPDQSKITNYAKQSQFPKKSNVYNRNFNNELQRKTNCGHLVKTNPNEANLARRSLGEGGFICPTRRLTHLLRTHIMSLRYSDKNGKTSNTE